MPTHILRRPSENKTRPVPVPMNPPGSPPNPGWEDFDELLAELDRASQRRNLGRAAQQIRQLKGDQAADNFIALCKAAELGGLEAVQAKMAELFPDKP